MRFGHLALLCPLFIISFSPAHAENITVTHYGRLIATLPWAIALEKNMFAEAGLDIDGITAGSGGGTAVRNMLASAIPLAEVGTPAALAAIEAGVDLVIIGAGSNHVGELAWGARGDSTITRVQDLKGKAVGFTSSKSVTEMVIRHVLKKENLTDDVQTLAMGGLGPSLTALSQGAIDASPVNDPILTLEPDKYNILFYAQDYMPKFTWAVNVTTRAFAQEQPETVRKFMAVHRRAVDFLYANPEEAAEIYARVWEIDRDEARAILPKYIEWRHWSPGDISKEGLDTMAETLMLVGELKAPVDWPALIDQRFLDDDLKSDAF